MTAFYYLICGVRQSRSLLPFGDGDRMSSIHENGDVGGWFMSGFAMVHHECGFMNGLWMAYEWVKMDGL